MLVFGYWTVGGGGVGRECRSRWSAEGEGKGVGGGGEPLQMVPESRAMAGSVGPIDLEEQELMKVERKRHRNRIAATRCRRRKLERIARLQDKVASLKAQNVTLENQAGECPPFCHI
uniref:Transcription factor JunB n=1 Tax=Eptatretus burgeri TaxID=7764 RepID=A0A8C4NHB0_EPTBU